MTPAKYSATGWTRVVIALKANTGTDEFEDADDAWYQEGLVKGTDATATPTQATLANKFWLLAEGTTGACNIATSTTIASATAAKFTAFTQGGEKVKVAVATNGMTLEGCTWSPASGLWSQGGFGGLIEIIGQAAGLGIPLGALIALAMLGGAFLGRMGLSPLMGVVIIIIAFTMAGSLLDTLTPFVTNAFESFDGNRFVIYSKGLGLLANIIGSFYGIVIFGGLLVIGWMVVQQYREAASQGMGGFLGGGDEGGYRLSSPGFFGFLREVADAGRDFLDDLRGGGNYRGGGVF